MLRTTTNAYNDDATLRSALTTDAAGQSLATCHYAGSDPASGYDADKHPLVVRTLSGTTSCSGGTLEREVTMAYDHRGLLATMTQKVRGASGMVARTQSFDHRPDTTLAAAVHDARTTTYARSPAGWTETLTDWRGKASTFAHSPAGAPTATSLGSGAAAATRTYAPDGAMASAVWNAGGTAVRAHTGIGYDVGGLRSAETVAVVHPATEATKDTGGPAAYAYDLARRLVSYTSPYKADPSDAAEPTVAYGLDDGANIATATTTVAGQTRLAESSAYPGGRLATRTSTATPAVGPALTTDTAFSYSPLGEESARTTTVAGLSSTTATTTYDAAGHVKVAGDVRYVYDGTDHLLSRTAGTETTLYFYWGMGTTLAEETDGAGQSLARYVVDGAEAMAQHTFRRLPGAGKDPTDLAGTWAWLLDDPAGNVATTVGDDGAVATQAAFDPYGAPEETGRSQSSPEAKSSLGFQAALTDPTTNKVILGPRQYDPATARFTNPDVFVAGAADVALGSDPLTGNRYLFAGANPVAYYENGYCFAGKEQSQKRRVDQRRRAQLVKVEDDSPAGYHWVTLWYTEDIVRSEKVCVRGGVVGQGFDYVSGNDITRGADSAYRNVFTSAEGVVARLTQAVLIDTGCAEEAVEGGALGLTRGAPGAAAGATAGCAEALILSGLVRLRILRESQARQVRRVSDYVEIGTALRDSLRALGGIGWRAVRRLRSIGNA